MAINYAQLTRATNSAANIPFQRGASRIFTYHSPHIPSPLENITERIFFTLRGEKLNTIDPRSSSPPSFKRDPRRFQGPLRRIPMRGSNPFDGSIGVHVALLGGRKGSRHPTGKGAHVSPAAEKAKPCCTCDHRLNGPFLSSRRRPNIQIMHGRPTERRRSALRSRYSNRSIVR